MTIKEDPRISETMYVIRNDIEYRSLPKSLSENLLSVQKLSKYFTVSTEAAIQIKSLFFAYIYLKKSANQSLILHFGFVLYNISCLLFFLKKQFTCVLTSLLARTTAASKPIASLFV